MWWQLRMKLLIWLLGKRWASTGTCANRKWWKRMVGPFEVTITMRHICALDGYSREELFEMLGTVRKHEALQGWCVPESGPDGSGHLRVTWHD